MSDLKDLMQKRPWTDIHRGVFSPEPLDDMDEHWVEVTEHSEMMCKTCKNFGDRDNRRDTCTQNRASCLNCASNWTRLGMYEHYAANMDEHAQDARVAARLINVYSECMEWKEMHAEKDLKGFLTASAHAMIAGYETSTKDVLKQVSHRGAIRMPAYIW